MKLRVLGINLFVGCLVIKNIKNSTIVNIVGKPFRIIEEGVSIEPNVATGNKKSKGEQLSGGGSMGGGDTGEIITVNMFCVLLLLLLIL